MTILIGSVLANQRGVWKGQNTVFYTAEYCALFFYALRSIISFFHASRTSIERTRYYGVGSTTKWCVQCNFSTERVRREMTETEHILNL